LVFAITEGEAVAVMSDNGNAASDSGLNSSVRQSRPRRPRTETDRLECVPQFQPSEIFDADQRIQFCDRVSRCLSDCIGPYVRSVEWEGKPTGLDRFLDRATTAIAYYRHKCEVRPQFDRSKAREQFEKAAEALHAAASRLNEISAWNELALYVREVYLSDRSDLKPRTSPARSKKWDKTAEHYDRTVAPSAIVNLLAPLEAALSLAKERVTLQPGDYQRNDAAKQFAEDMAVAWISGTGEIPACATRSKRSRNPSPFAAMLAKINEGIFKDTPAWSGAKESFFGYAQMAKEEMNSRYPELVRRPQKKPALAKNKRRRLARS
jgi:hypothetical protein